MPRDGSNIYHRPPGTDGVPNYTVESARYNAFTADVEQDLNLPRPVIAGGTGANNAADAMNNLGGELSAQLIVNYNSDPFQAGSFYSAAGATGAPTRERLHRHLLRGSDHRQRHHRPVHRGARPGHHHSVGAAEEGQRLADAGCTAAGVAIRPTVPTGVAAEHAVVGSERGKLFIYYDDGDS